MSDPGTLDPAEPHPSAFSAQKYISKIDPGRINMYLEAFASSAIEGNRLAAVCAETLSRLLRSDPVSDRYVLGLAWALRNMEDERNESVKC